MHVQTLQLRLEELILAPILPQENSDLQPGKIKIPRASEHNSFCVEKAAKKSTRLEHPQK